jgi:hypothetical protein
LPDSEERPPGGAYRGHRILGNGEEEKRIMNKSFAILFGAVLAAGVTSVGCTSNEAPAASDNGAVSNVIDTRAGDNVAVDNQGENKTEGTSTTNVGTDSQSDASADARKDEGENYAKPESRDYEAEGGNADAGETSVIDTTDGAKTEPVADVNAEGGNTDATATESDAPTTTDGGADTGSSAGTDKASDAGTGEATPDSGNESAAGND